MAIERLSCDGDSLELFHIIDTIIYGQEKYCFFCCTANQSGTGHKVHLQPKNPVSAKLAAINNKNSYGTAEV